MQDRYTGDVGDFGKYGLLRALTSADLVTGLRLGVVWCLVDDEAHNEDGRYTEYLSGAHEPEFRSCDPSLYDELKSIVRRGDRSVAAIEASGVLPAGTKFYRQRLDYATIPSRERPAARRDWHSGAVAVTSDCDLVFFDPDNGLATDRMRVGYGDSKHTFIDELRPSVRDGQSVVVYHHFSRNGSHADQLKREARRIAERLALPELPLALRYRPWSPRAFFILPSDRHRELIEARIDTLLGGPWAAHFATYRV